MKKTFFMATYGSLLFYHLGVIIRARLITDRQCKIIWDRIKIIDNRLSLNKKQLKQDFNTLMITPPISSQSR
jgi:hypothetical protein